jgi:hypothetical protein
MVILLILKNLVDGSEKTFAYVKDYAFAENGSGLLFMSSGNDADVKAGVYWHDLTSGVTTQVFEGHPKHKYKYLSIDEAGEQIAFIADIDTTKALLREPKLMYWKKR